MHVSTGWRYLGVFTENRRRASVCGISKWVYPLASRHLGGLDAVSAIDR